MDFHTTLIIITFQYENRVWIREFYEFSVGRGKAAIKLLIIRVL